MAQFFAVRGDWEARQSNGFIVNFFIDKQVLRASDPAFTDVAGRASHSGGTVQGRVEGAVSGNQFFALVFWENQIQGEYSGTFGLVQPLPHLQSNARLNGFTHDRMNPQHQATWFTTDRFVRSEF
jgi:hypothetical protein